MINLEPEYTLFVLGRKWLTDDTFELSCTRPDSFNFFPGQHVTFCLDLGQREYTITSSVEESVLCFLIKVVSGGSISRWLSQIDPGSEISVTGPRGYMVKRVSARPAVFAATGTGIAPFVSMAKSGVSARLLLHGAAFAQGLFYKDLLVNCYARYIQCLSRQPVREGKSESLYSGYVTDYLENVLEPGVYDFYLCGKWEMIRRATHVIDQRFPDSTVTSEGFY